ncbi:FAD-dependent oxidoreductase [Micromonospora sp. NPDC005367]|uniref:FAD-dependent oxidoreductase n=1 Tax=Micromonospora sp. NPDC005367 TaxID=3155590 RepID=UPI0033A3D7A9
MASTSARPAMRTVRSAALVIGGTPQVETVVQHRMRPTGRHLPDADTAEWSTAVLGGVPAQTGRCCAGRGPDGLSEGGGGAVADAAGRAPRTAQPRLDAAGVRTTDSGAVEVDQYLRTSRPDIFAVGDVNGGPQFTYIALDDYRIVADQMAGEGKRSTADRVAVPYTLFMTPPLARAGTVETDAILGAALLSVDEQELVNTVAPAIRGGVTAGSLRDAIWTHPSSTEAFNEVLANVVR